MEALTDKWDSEPEIAEFINFSKNGASQPIHKKTNELVNFIQTYFQTK